MTMSMARSGDIRGPVKILRLCDDGRGEGRLEDRAVLCSQALPGDEVRVKVDRVSRGLIQGRVHELLFSGGKRYRHPCPHEFHCTGCPLLSASPEFEQRFKLHRIETALASWPERPAVPELEIPTELFGYRRLAKQVFQAGPRGATLGSFVAGTHQVTSNRGCPILAPDLAEAIARIEYTLRRARVRVAGDPAASGLRYLTLRGNLAGQQLLLRLTSIGQPSAALPALVNNLLSDVPGLTGIVLASTGAEEGNVFAGKVVHTIGTSTVTEHLGAYTYRFGSESFFQVNPLAAARLFALAGELAGTGERCLEAYAGVGAMTLPLAARYSEVLALESDPAAVTALRRNAEANGLGNLHVLAGKVEETLAAALESQRPDLVLADPPRKGLGIGTVEQLGRSKVPRVILLSCDPTALGRDGAGLLSQGFKATRLVALDQFPRTAHVETVTLFER